MPELPLLLLYMRLKMSGQSLGRKRDRASFLGGMVIIGKRDRSSGSWRLVSHSKRLIIIIVIGKESGRDDDDEENLSWFAPHHS